MISNPNFTVRFYVRTTKTQGGDSLTPLRVKVWISGTKSYLYYSTKVSTTKRIWADFASDGTPSPGADPTLTKVVDTYKTATNLIVSAAIANDRIKDLTSEQLSLRIDAVVECMDKQQKETSTNPILVFTTPEYVPLCKDCKHYGKRCKAEWNTEDEADVAPDKALYTHGCAHYGMSQKQYLRNLMSFISDNALRNLLENPDMPTDLAYRQLHPATIKMGGGWIEDALEKAREDIRMTDPLYRMDKTMEAIKEFRSKRKDGKDERQ